MKKLWVVVAASIVLGAAPAMARDRGVDFGRDYGDNSAGRHRSHNRGRTWMHNDRGHWGGHHGGHPGMSHDYFSPRGQGGHHWGW